jgi:hypothetical protein
MKIVAFYNFKGGVGSTTYTKHTCIRAREHGLAVVGASLGHLHDLQNHLRRADVPWQDGLVSLPETCDLLVLDVYAQSELVDVIKPDLWVMPMYDRMAVDNAVRILPSLQGPAWWLPSHGHHQFHIPAGAQGRVTLARPVPASDAMRTSYEEQVPVWATHPGSEAAIAIEGLVANMLVHLGLAGECHDIHPLTYSGGPRHDYNVVRDYRAREEAARPRLAAYFENIWRQRAN